MMASLTNSAHQKKAANAAQAVEAMYEAINAELVLKASADGQEVVEQDTSGTPTPDETVAAESPDAMPDIAP
jgi:hypothetical protein